MMSGFFDVLAVKGGWFALLLLLGALPAAGSSISPARTVLAWPQSQETSDSSTKKMSIKEYVEEALRLSGIWENKRRTVQKLLDTAKKDKNVIRQNCIEPKLKDVQFGIEEGNSTVSIMKEGQGGSVSQERMELLFQKVRVIDSNIEEAVMEAGRCIGDEQFSSGEGFEIKSSHPDEVPFDPDSAPIILDDPLAHNDNYIPVNPDWSVEMTWPNASPYK